MAYISNPVYLGVGAVDSADASALATNAKFSDTFSAAYAALSAMSTAERQQVLMRVKAVLDKMPYNTMEMHIETALKAAKVLDPRRAPGLGQIAALGTVAQVAGIIASVATTGFAVANFINQRKTQKEQQSAAQSQQALVEQQMALEIAAKKQALATQQKQDNIAVQKAQLDAQGLTVDATGAVVKKSPVTMIAALAAAGAGAFFLAK